MKLYSSCCGAKILDEWECSECGKECHGEVNEYEDNAQCEQMIEERIFNDSIDGFVDDQIEAHNERTEIAFENTFYEGTGND